MIALCVASPEGQVGKTAICSAIARRLLNDGKKVGYFKPVSVIPEGAPARSGYLDCDFMNQVLELGKPVESLCPVVVTAKDLAQAARVADDITKKVRDAYQSAAKDKDAMVIEGPAGLAAGSAAARLLGAVLGAIPAKLVVVVQYGGRPLLADFDGIAPELRGKVVGLVVNGVPARRMEVKQELIAGVPVPVLGVLPQDRTLRALTLAEVAQAVGAEPAGNGGELVENIMLGAAVLDHGPSYFNRKAGKAVLIRGERPDMQLAALETPTKLMVLTGGVKPIDQVSKQAKRRRVPVVVTAQDTQQALASLSEATKSATFTHRQKLARFEETMAANFDFKALYKVVGA